MSAALCKQPSLSHWVTRVQSLETTERKREAGGNLLLEHCTFGAQVWSLNQSKSRNIGLPTHLLPPSHNMSPRHLKALSPMPLVICYQSPKYLPTSILYSTYLAKRSTQLILMSHRYLFSCFASLWMLYNWQHCLNWTKQEPYMDVPPHHFCAMERAFGGGCHTRDLAQRYEEFCFHWAEAPIMWMST